MFFSNGWSGKGRHIKSYSEICSLPRQPHIRRKPAETRPQHLLAMLIDGCSRGVKQTLLLVLLREGDGAGDGIADRDRCDIVEMHLCRQKADHAADVGYHAAGEQAGDVAPPEKVALRECFVNMVGVIIAGHTTEERHVTLGKGAAKGEGLPDL